jgi:hypothetical protein
MCAASFRQGMMTDTNDQLLRIPAEGTLAGCVPWCDRYEDSWMIRTIRVVVCSIVHSRASS